MTQIQLRHESFGIDYKNVSLPALFCKQSTDSDFSSSALLNIVDANELLSIITKARQTLMIACDQIKANGLIQALKEKADSGVRIYLLLGDLKSNQMAIDTLSGRCLVRTGVAQKGALILVDHATSQAQGLLLMNQQSLAASGDKDWTIQLNPQQIDDSFRSFCKLFWEETDSEYLQQNQPQEKVVHPDGSIVTNHSHQLCGTLKDCLDETLNSLTGASCYALEGKGSSYRLLLGSNSPKIAQLARNGVVLTDSHIPTLLFSNDGNWLLPDSPDFNIANWCLKLSDAQTNELSTIYNQAIEAAAWQYLPDITIGELLSNQLLRFADQPDSECSVELSRHKSLEPINTDTIDSFLSDTAQSLAANAIAWQRDFIAHKIDYQITIHPPYCPPGANKDELYDQWQKAEQDWQERLSSLEHQQITIDEQQAGIADRFSGFLKSFLLGQGQSVKQLNQELEKLKRWSVTKATPAERELHRNSLERLQSLVSQRSKDTAGKLDEAEQSQRWIEKQALLTKVLGEAKAIIQSQVTSKQQLLDRKEEKQQQVESAFLADWPKALESLKDKSFEQIGLSLDSLAAMNVEQAEQWKDSFKEKVWTKHYGAFSKVLENRRLALQKIERDILVAENAVQKSLAELKQAQKNLQDHGDQFIFHPKNDNGAFDKLLGLKNKTDQSGPFSWPDEELPAEGIELRNHNKQRYLVLFDIDQLEQARKYAEQLKAKIVCNKESVNA